MEVTKSYPCVGTCSKMIVVSVDEGVITNAQIIGGCPGNTVGVSALVVGMKVQDAISRLKGIDCGGRGTSCPDQMAKALEKFL
ncbi:MAG: TIGR03905 family TSCPD domain-containing protein [Paludibacteraceae bacterium]|nr:TIGR03905 family TSCPD domain-containing protein [Paludibacteraceae bacterium]